MLAGEKTSQPVDAAVEIVDGTATIRDEATGRRWTFDGFNCVFIASSETSTPLTIEMKTMLAVGNGKQPLSVAGTFANAVTSRGSPAPRGNLSATIGALPLELVQTLARRFATGLELAGTASGQLRSTFDFSATEPAASAEGRLTVYDLAVGGSALHGDQIRLAQVDMPLKVAVAGNRLTIDQLGAACELGTVAVQGSVDGYRRLLTVDALPELLDLLTQCEGRATAQASLAKIGQAMPHLLRLRDDVQITSGDVTLAIVGDRNPQGLRQWRAEAAASALKAVRQSGPLEWNEPIQAVVEAVDSPAGPVVQRIACRSDFFTATGTNNTKSFDFTAQYDLQRLVERSGQFIDLGGMRLRGTGTAQGTWIRLSDDRFDVDAQASIGDFQLSVPGKPTWTEAQLVLGIQAVGRAVGLSIASVDEGAVGVQAGADQLTAKLTAPVKNVLAADTVWPLAVEGRGDLKSWLTRLRPFMGLPDYLAAEGRANLTAAVRLRRPDEIEVTESRIHAEPLRVAMPGLAIDEPTADLTAAARYNATDIEIREALLTTPSLVAQVRNFLYATPTGRLPELVGEGGIRADVARLRTVFGPTAPQSLQVAGLLEGSAKMQRTGTVVAASLDAGIKDFAVAQAGRTAWREPQLRIVGSGLYDPLNDAAVVDRLEVAGEALRMLLAGKVTQLSSTRIADLKGEAACDLARVTPIVQSFIGNGVSLAGNDTQRFELTGPLYDADRKIVPWEKLNGSARVGWDRIDLYGFPIGKQAVEAQLREGVVAMNPLVVPVSGGRVRLEPTLRLAGQQELRLAPGVLADHITITPEMANQHLKYVVPIMAGVAQVGGAFSVVIDQLRVPLDHPENGEIEGKLTVHSVDIGPGYITQELATLLQQPLTVGLTRESTVDFKMIQGRIYHQNLEFAFPGVTVRTHGSAGLADQSLSMLAEIQLSGQRLGNLPIAQQLVSSQAIRLPITGTLSKPAIDARALAEATGQTLRNAAEGALEQGLNRGLQKLLGPSGALTPALPR